MLYRLLTSIEHIVKDGHSGSDPPLILPRAYHVYSSEKKATEFWPQHFWGYRNNYLLKTDKT
jgi:hypothetical protein